MPLATHGRYAYSPLPERPVWDWPNGARLAVYIAINVEAFPFAEGLGIPLVNPLPEPDVVNFGWRDWGNRVGIWYLLDALAEHGLPAAALMNTEIIDLCPQVPAALLARGDEIVGHGRTNAERQSDMDEAAERAMIRECRDRLLALTGAPPRGWMGPWVAETHRTPEILADAGFDYVMDWPHDDQPTLLRTARGRDLVAVPYARPLNDLPALHAAKWTPAEWADATLDGFEEMLRLSARHPIVFNLSLHPFLVGWPARLRHLRRIFARLAASAAAGEVWLCTPGAIAAHARPILSAQGKRA
ncbi:polysaccharide deacetylase [Roseomonas sp. KE2513]|uniref:polysaccharide deacetylase family protein n=1 Tax=Roseomonas sp. KE2513 TaxID=2479202 RepID=UPI0018DF8617|nr:polysaccharide deacetylase family protein [Roseomonas sp. KE2513]MBI0535785.1 polysaccharide deacetylase [Roseomonas sp. KE2513]